MKVILLTTDLMTASQVAGAAAQAGVDLTTAETVESTVRQAEEQEVNLVVLDLSAPGIRPADLIEQLADLPCPPPVVAFGPHVHMAKLKAAREAGCRAVLTRGQFFSDVSQVLRGQAPQAEG